MVKKGLLVAFRLIILILSINIIGLFYNIAAEDLGISSKSVVKGVTVFIHGTLLPLHSYFIHKIDCPLGLTNGKNLSKKHILSRIGHILHEIDSENFDLNLFYLFGWNGKLGFNYREIAACELYQELRNFKVPITLITHSHGGNVVLNLAKIAIQANDTNFKIDRLIVLACPVQHATSKYIKSPIFKKIYSLYSTADLTQIIDPQGLYIRLIKRLEKKNRTSIFSQRVFPPADNLIQVRVRLNNEDPWHFDFRREKFLKHLPSIIELLESQDIKHLSKADICNKIYVSDCAKPRLKIKFKKNKNRNIISSVPFDKIFE